MDFKDVIKQLGERIAKVKDSIQTEEATKNAAIMPFISALGYDVFNPLEVVPEFTCDIGTKKGEKIDYAIMKDGNPIILMECKHWGQELSLHDNQLLRYFHVSTAKFGVLTNGIEYKFYTDLETPNKMDEKPFLEINIQDLKDTHVEELKKFHKSYFDVSDILSSASELKYTNELKRVINEEFLNPSADLVRLFAKQVYEGIVTAKVLEQFTDLMKKSFNSYINEKITDRLNAALKKEKITEEKETEQPATEPEDDSKKIITTEEELESLYLIKAILRPYVNVERVVYRDTVSYFNIILDDNIRKTICRMYLNGTKKYIGLFDEARKETKYPIENLNDIYNYSDAIINTLKSLDKGKEDK